MKQNKTLSSMFVSSMFVYIMIFVLMAFSVSAAQSAVNLGSAGNFAILAKSGISTTGTTSIVGDIGASPIDSTGITGFGLIVDSSNQFATSSLIIGKVYAADYTSPTPAILTTAVSDMQTAYTDAAGRTLPDKTELGAGDISGMTLAPGLYKWGTGVLINNGVTLSGNANDVWIFQIAQDLTVGNGAIITLSGGAQAKNIFWVVAGQASLGTTSDFKGNILSQTAIILSTGATLNGRALAQTAVTLDASSVSLPTAGSTPPVNPPPINNCIDCAAPSSGCKYVNASCQTCGALVCNGNDGSQINNSQCSEWSTCGSDGVQTRTCTYPSSSTILTKTQSCTPTQTTPVVNTPPVANSGDNEQNTVTTGHDNNGNTPTGGTPQNGYKTSWWSNFTAWVSRLFGGQ